MKDLSQYRKEEILQQRKLVLSEKKPYAESRSLERDLLVKTMSKFADSQVSHHSSSEHRRSNLSSKRSKKSRQNNADNKTITNSPFGGRSSSGIRKRRTGKVSMLLPSTSII